MRSIAAAVTALLFCLTLSGGLHAAPIAASDAEAEFQLAQILPNPPSENTVPLKPDALWLPCITDAATGAISCASGSVIIDISGIVVGNGPASPITAYAGTSGAAHTWITALNAFGAGTFVRPACADLSDAGSGCSGAAAAPGGSSGDLQINNGAGGFGGYGGTSGAAHQWITALAASGVGTFARPACADLSDAGAGCTGSGVTAPGGGNGAVQYNSGGAFAGVVLTGLQLDNGASAPSAYAGASCTNQFVRSLNGSGAATCATVGAADVSLASLSHDSTLTGTAYTGSAAVTNWGIDLTHANTWSGTQTFGPVMGTVSTQAATSYTLAATDCGTTIRFTNASAITLTLPDSIAAGCSVALLQVGAGQVTPTVSGGASLNSRPGYTKTAGQWALVGLTIDSNAGSAAHYVLTGDGV